MMDMHQPQSIRPAYWDQACEQLMQRDRILRKLIPVYGQENIQLRPCPFQALVRIILGQQISLALGRTLWARLAQACGHDMQPGCIGRFTQDELRALGLSLRKAQYVQTTCEFFSQPLHMDADWWHAQDNASIIARLCEIRGVGRWSADMFLIFFLGRPDILPLDDMALLKAISQHYFSGEPVSRFEAREVSQAWTPWRTVASWYLWRSMDAAAVEY